MDEEKNTPYAEGYEEGYEDGQQEETFAVLRFIMEQGDGLTLLESLRRGDHRR